MAERAEGWYMDPHNPRVHRYWDGETWVDHDSGVDRSGTDPDGESA